MLTVKIEINGRTIYERDAINQARSDAEGKTIYLLDNGQRIRHRRSDGAIELAKKLLSTLDPVKDRIVYTGLSRPPDETL